MKSYLKQVVVLFLFWLLMFAMQRMLFLIFFNPLSTGQTFGEIMASFIHGFSMDIAATCYLMALPILVSFVGLFYANKPMFKVYNIINYVLVICISLIFGADLGLFRSWRSRINAKAISFLTYPKEAAASCASSPIFMLILFVAISALIGWWLYKRYGKVHNAENTGKNWHKIVVMPILLALLFLGMRGGFQIYPLSRSWVFYSKYPVLNNAALNGTWNLLDILFKSENNVNPYQYMPFEKANKIVDEMFDNKSDSTLMILKNQRPNIVFIALESFSADNSAFFGGDSIATYMDTLASEGIAFTNFYSTGFRTEQGMVAYLNSFPAQPKATIMRKFGKFDYLPNMMRTLDSSGYKTAYFSSGNEEFANTKAYLITSGVGRIYGQQEFVNSRRYTAWGCYDDELFDYHLKKAGEQGSPFFHMLFTLTSHEPFDAKVTPYFKGEGELSGYKNTVRFTDSCLYSYIRKAEKQSWYANTLFVITADHAHTYPKRAEYNSPERHHIPLILLGGAIKTEYLKKRIKSTSSQLDIACTILKQLGLDASAFAWSNNMFNPNKPNFAFYTFDDGFGFVTDSVQVAYDHQGKRVVYNNSKDNSKVSNDAIEKGKAFLQVMFDKFLKLSQ